MTLHRTGRADPWQRIEDWPHPVEQPIAPVLATEFAAVDRAAGQNDAALLTGRWRLAPDVIEQTEGRPGAADPEHLIFRQQRGFRRATALDTASAAILGVCDGELDLATIIDVGGRSARPRRGDAAPGIAAESARMAGRGLSVLSVRPRARWPRGSGHGS